MIPEPWLGPEGFPNLYRGASVYISPSSPVSILLFFFSSDFLCMLVLYRFSYTGRSPFHKVFVSVVTLQLVDKKLLSLDDTVGSFLTEDVTRDIPHARTVTIAELQTHYSGIPSWEDDPNWIIQG
jgi:hypothetical protein